MRNCINNVIDIYFIGQKKVLNKACNTYFGTLSRLELIPNNSASNDPIWYTYLGSPVTCIACDARWACVACADGALHAWRLARTHATRALPPIALKSQAAKLTLSGDMLAVVTTSAHLSIYDLSNATCVIKPLCFRNLLSAGVTVTNCSFLNDNNQVISLSNGKSYIYCQKLSAWVIWSDTSDPVRRAGGGAGLRAPLRAPGRVPGAPRLPQAPGRTLVNVKALSGASRSWLEAQVAACLHLRLAGEYRHWLTALFEDLLQHGTEEQLRQILDDMLGPSHCTSTPKTWQNTVLGLKKHDILEELLSVLVRQMRWQRLYTEYHDQLRTLRDTTLVNGF